MLTSLALCHATWLLPRTVLVEDSEYTGYALRSGQEAAEHNKEHNLDLCLSQTVRLAGQWLSGPQSIYTSIYLSSETKQKKIPGHTQTWGSN